MLGQNTLFRAAGALASHAAERQEVLTQNVANADTPNYRARDLRSFDLETLTRSHGTLLTTRRQHVSVDQRSTPAFSPEVEVGPASPNGNAVSLEREMVRAADINRQHDLALTVYSSAMKILRTSLGRG